jgi:Secretion system C-terminal sorting domain
LSKSNPNTEGSLFQVINLLGQQVLVGKTTQQLDVSALPQGAYIFKVGTEQAKFVKQ